MKYINLCFFAILIFAGLVGCVEEKKLIEGPEIIVTSYGEETTGLAEGFPGTDKVRIEGKNFSTNPQENLVSFNGVGAEVLSATATELLVTVPLEANSGMIEVSKKAGKSVTAGHFTIKREGAPEITEILKEDKRGNRTPSRSFEAGEILVIRGKGFIAEPAKNLLLINRQILDAASQILSASSNEIRIIVPANATTGDLYTVVRGVSSKKEFVEFKPLIISDEGTLFWVVNPSITTSENLLLVQGAPKAGELPSGNIYTGQQPDLPLFSDQLTVDPVLKIMYEVVNYDRIPGNTSLTCTLRAHNLSNGKSKDFNVTATVSNDQTIVFPNRLLPDRNVRVIHINGHSRVYFPFHGQIRGIIITDWFSFTVNAEGEVIDGPAKRLSNLRDPMGRILDGNNKIKRINAISDNRIFWEIGTNSRSAILFVGDLLYSTDLEGEDQLDMKSGGEPSESITLLASSRSQEGYVYYTEGGASSGTVSLKRVKSPKIFSDFSGGEIVYGPLNRSNPLFASLVTEIQSLAGKRFVLTNKYIFYQNGFSLFLIRKDGSSVTPVTVHENIAVKDEDTGNDIRAIQQTLFFINK